MDMQNVIYAVAVLFIMGIVFAILLGVAAKVFAVEVDERIPLASACRALTAAAAASRAVTAWLLRSSRAALRSTAAL